MAANQNFIPGVTGWTGLSFMPNPQAHAAAAGTLTNPTGTSNSVGGAVLDPANLGPANQPGPSGPSKSLLNDPSLGSNPGAAGNGAGLSPVLTATAFGTNNIPAFLTQGLNQLNSNYGNQQQWFDLVSKILGLAGQNKVDPETDLLKTRIMAEAINGGPARARATSLTDRAFDTSQPFSGMTSLWGNSQKRQYLDQAAYMDMIANGATPKNLTMDSSTRNYNYNPAPQPQQQSGWGPRMPSF